MGGVSEYKEKKRSQDDSQSVDGEDAGRTRLLVENKEQCFAYVWDLN